MTYIFLVLGFVILIYGADLLVKGSSKIAAALGISPLIVGLTVVAFGTSAPEMAVNIISSISGKGDIGLGNVIGSNIFNILFTLGISAIIIPLFVSKQLIKIDVPLMIFISISVYLMAFNGVIGIYDGLFLFLGAILYNFFLIKQSKKEREIIKEKQNVITTDSKLKFYLINSFLIILGIALLIQGSKWLVDSSIDIARAFNVSELIIGLTIIAIGTSLPEVATSIVASLKGERDIAVGNLIGSNIFNLLLVLGISAVFSPNGIPVNDAALNFDLPIMVAVAVACLPIFFTGNRIDRWEGFLFLIYYFIYTGYLILKTAEHDAIYKFTMIMIYFVLPITFLTLLVFTYRSIKVKK